ncbi:MAG: Uncharacterized protein JWL59_1337, partial [Chthoniobacteraceae bacterium]|nr:Uncharacterized protein [Chthoniobacteraceae bacterium]
MPLGMKSRFLSFLLCLVALAGPPQARAVVVKTYADLPTVTTLSDGDLITAWSLADARAITFANFKALLPFQPIDPDLTALAALTTTSYGRSLLTGSDANATRITLGLGGAALLNVGTTAGTVAAGDHTHAFSALSGIPTTLAGYGITDAASLTHTHAFSALTGKPTTLAGYGITDGLTLGSTSLTAAAGNHNHALSSLTGNLAVSQLGGGTGATATTFWRGDGTWATPAGTGGGTVNSVAITTANGISGTVANPTSTPAITLTLGAITPISIVSSGTISGSNLSGTNTGDQTITLTGDVTGTGTGSFATAIGAGKVTLAMQASMATASLLGRNTAGSGAPEVLSASTAKSLLALNLVENAALSTWSGSTAVNTLGTITAGTWNGTSIDLATRSTGLLPTASFPGSGFNGINQLVQLTGAGKLPALDGSLLTGLSSGFSNPMSAVGDIIYGGTAGTATRLAGPIANSLYLLTSQGTGTVATAPAFTALATAMSGYQTALTNSAGLLGALSDETGTGLAVFATSPTLVTPILGVATATSVNKITITAPATSATLTLAQGSSLITAGAFS